jgi:hypothetical protein
VSYFTNPSHQSLCLYLYYSYRFKATARLKLFLHSVLGNGLLNTFPLQRIHAIVEELFDASFSIRSVSYQRRVCGSVCVSSIVARRRLGKHVPAATNNSCRLRFLCGACRIKGKQAIISSQNFLCVCLFVYIYI